MTLLVSLGRARFGQRVHRIVLETFVGPCPDGMEGCHNDGNPINNRVDNLRWDTRASNRADMLVHGTTTKPPTHWGEDHHNAKMTDAEVAEVARSDEPLSVAARKYDVSKQTIWRIRNGKTRRRAAEAAMYGGDA